MSKLEKTQEKDIVRTELIIQILKTINNFKSTQNPHYKLDNSDIIHILSKILYRKTQ